MTRSRSTGPSVLIVEDDEGIGSSLLEGLQHEGFIVRWVRTGTEAIAAERPDLVVLDLGLPDIDGTQVCRKLREGSDVPIIVVTARGDEMDRVLLLEMGADDYVAKPFGFRELVARMRAVLRRSQRHGDPVRTQEIGELRIDRRMRRVDVAGREIGLTPKEFDLLSVLAEDPGAVVTREDLIERVGTHTGGARRRRWTFTSPRFAGSSAISRSSARFGGSATACS